eukprot:CAMPEP_0197527466 /NCGR_PEP_ID=MMETSP1318-20131121/21773_1 /TAXON_ID=552666 /ORGANISM="Partenskyella glossopodia, Strain RCC365" /LENGTH=157 /DNA_ID=CAMNT_0043082135 /DNA_START=134 /DNA_END=604 /DNA_ORIENTATION=+
MPKKKAGAKRKSSRVKSQSKKISTLDADQRQRAINKRLDRLEEDNYKEEVDLNDATYVDGEEEEIVTAGSRKKKKKPKRVKLATKSFSALCSEANIQHYPDHIPTYLSIAARPSAYPPPRICSVSGNPAKYDADDVVCSIVQFPHISNIRRPDVCAG